MTVSTTGSKVTYQGDGATTNWPFFFAVPPGLPSQIANDLIVTVVNSSGQATVIPFGPGSTQYQLNLNSPTPANPTPVGGTVIYAQAGVGIPLGSTITIQRTLAATQLVSLLNQGILWQPVVEAALDYLTMLDQQIMNFAGNLIQAPQTDPAGLNYTVPPAAQRANQAFLFDSAGNATVGQVLPQGVVSSAMQPVVSAASIALARSLLGLGTMAIENIGGGLADDGGGNARVIFNVNKVSGPTTVIQANYLQKIKATGPLTITLNRGNTYFPGFGFWLEVTPGSTGPVTIAINAADQFENLPSGQSIVAAVGSSAFINTDAATNAIWFLELSRGAQATAPPVGVYSGGLSIDVTSNTTATCSVGSVVVSDGQNYFTTTPTGGINTATIGPGGIDVGPLANNTFYNVWVIYGTLSGTSTWIISLASTFAALKANLPPTYNAGARLGRIKTAAASTNMNGTRQRGKRIEYLPGVGALTGYPSVVQGVVGNPVTPTWVSESLTGIVPSDAAYYRGALWLNTSSIAGVQNCAAAPSSAFGAVGSTTNPPPAQLSQGITLGAGQANNGPVSIPFEFTGGGPVFYASNFAASGIYILGWEENL